VSKDVVVVGLGVIGLSTAAELAARGDRVVGIERVTIGHAAGSSTGASRSIRATYEQPHYAHLVLRAIDRWQALASATGRSILHLTGQIDLGPEAKLRTFVETVGSAGIAIEELDAIGLQGRFPELAPRPDEIGVFHPTAGTVLAEAAMAALAERAVGYGATLLEHRSVSAIEPTTTGIAVETAEERFGADVTVVAAGPWSNGLLEPIGLALPLAPALGQVTFFEKVGLVDRPAFADWHVDAGEGVYGHPVPGIGYKLGFDAAGTEPWRADAGGWDPEPAEEGELLSYIRSRLPGFPARPLKTQRHPWTMTPDSDFVIDRRGAVTVAAGCSGHAFKFGPALGELIADVVDGVDRGDAVPFRMDRPALAATAPPPDTPIAR
jgi:sarcosine oxidase